MEAGLIWGTHFGVAWQHQMFSVKVGRALIGLLTGCGLWACASEDGALDAAPLDSGCPIDLGSPLDAAEGNDLGDPGDADAGAPFDGASADLGNPTHGRWESRAPLPAGPRQETAVVAVGEEIFVVGGFDQNAAFGAVVEAYRPADDCWRRVADVPARLHHANAAAVDGRLYVLGFLGTDFRHDSRAWVYDGAADRWDPLANLPPTRARGAAAVAVLDGRIYLVGGLRNGVSVADFDVYDPATGAWLPLPPLPRVADHLVAGAIAGKLYAVGGRAGSITRHTPRVDIYDPATGVWSAGPEMPTSRGGMAAAVLGEALYVFGGEGNAAAPTGVFDVVERWEPGLNRWTTLAPMNPGRHGTGAASLDGRIYVPGGAKVEAFGAVARLEVFIP